MTKQDLVDLLIINDAADDISEAISSVFGEIGEEGRFVTAIFCMRMLRRSCWQTS
jgi:hypothetical protein